MMIAIKLKVNDIEKERIFVSEKGNKYLDLVIVGGDKVDVYGNDGFVAHSMSKQEREEGKRGKIVGNWKYLFRDNSRAGTAGAPPPKPVENDKDPF